MRSASFIRVSETHGGSAWGFSLPRPELWTEKALCAQTDPDAFFPEKGGTTKPGKRICQGCEVRDECLKYALDNDERFGIWGGLSERERRRLKRELPPPPPAQFTCKNCHTPFTKESRRGPAPMYCSHACRDAVYMRRKAEAAA